MEQNNLLWWLVEEADEYMPSGLDGPDDFILRGLVEGKDSQFYYVGRKPEDDGDDQYVRESLFSIGDIATFFTQKYLGDVQITFYKDGTYKAHGDIPTDYNGLWEMFEPEFSGDTLEEVCNWVKDGTLEVEDGEIKTISFVQHNREPLIFRLAKADNKMGATFEQIAGYVMADGTVQMLLSDVPAPGRVVQ